MGDVLRLAPTDDGLPAWVDRALWADWREDRRLRKRPMTAVSERRLLSKLQQLVTDARALGWAPDEAQEAIVSRSIECGWWGFFPLHDPPEGAPASNRLPHSGPLTMNRLRNMSAPEVKRLADDLGVATLGRRDADLFPRILDAWKRSR